MINKIALIIITISSALSISAMDQKLLATEKFDKRKQAKGYEHKKTLFSVINRVRKLERLDSNKVDRRAKEVITRDDAQILLQDLYLDDYQEGSN